MPEKTFDVLVVGAGPAGLAAACCASEAGGRVAILDDNSSPGGQIWRGEANRPTSAQAAQWIERLHESPVEIFCGARVIDQPQAGVLLVDRDDDFLEIGYEKLVVATGARERFLPFPGWTLPNVMGAGGLQALVKSGLPIEGRTVAVAGTGPLLLAVAAYLKKRGARVPVIAEQAPPESLFRFGMGLLAAASKLSEAVRLRWKLRAVRYATGCWPVAAEGRERLEAVTFSDGRRTWEQSCDYLACGFGLVPNIELASLLGCDVLDGAVVVDEWQQTSVPGVFCAGETTGVGGLELSLAEGQIAGCAASGEQQRARGFFDDRARALRFKRSLDRAFALRDELRALPESDSIVCRCEDVPFEKLQQQTSWREAKLQTRCGMGPCQGRICGPAVEFLLGWKAESVRPPILPSPLGRLVRE